MNLAERLRVRNSKLIYGTPNVFRYKDERVYNYVDLIFMVLEKYSKLFGEVTPEKSDRLKLQLAEKYTNSHHKTLVGLDIKLFVGKVERLSLIRDKYWKTRSAILENKWAKQIKIDELTLAYKESKTYVLIADKGHLECDCCGLVFPSDMLKCLNRWVICNSKKCSAVAAKFPRGASKYPLLNVIKALVINGGANETRAKLEKHFVRNAG